MVVAPELQCDTNLGEYKMATLYLVLFCSGRSMELFGGDAWFVWGGGGGGEMFFLCMFSVHVLRSFRAPLLPFYCLAQQMGPALPVLGSRSWLQPHVNNVY